ncbi:aldo/keto reductase [Cerasicoccus arenae]|uniref:Glyceraldehyde 3-phosphate reductase n=1 Tax=Cerasicoccus arenae TaxID=424488 RepID=A0A8J3DBE3_9BACT|nr:aldo/keto reductase [Cerasicoccus arenae]MBK1856669.1 aldo/keto reductase [Cerasicoccus arenae]GHB98795.1 glyceraldehyde 3-phosphate reductase [Cerasicoccus arenae]
MSYSPSDKRYSQAGNWFRHSGHSGLKLPAVSLGAWHNFGAPGTDSLQSTNEASINENCRQMLFTAFDLGITHFDLANNYGPPPGSAEERCGKIIKQDFAGYRDELIISTKAGYGMWAGPYGDGGSRKYIVSSCDQSLKRLKLDYVDIFYHHRPDPNTPLEETLAALDYLVKSGRALYTGISNYYAPEHARQVVELCRRHGWATPIIHQFSYSMLSRENRDALLRTNGADGVGTIIFSPLAGGLLTGKYLKDVPKDSRAGSSSTFLKADNITPALQAQLRALNEVASARGQTLAQLALAWVLRHPETTSVLIGASRPQQVIDCAKSLDAGPLSDSELEQIDDILQEPA